MKTLNQPKKNGAMKRRAVAALCAVVMLAVCVPMIGGTLAYLMDKTPELVNRFELGNLTYVLQFDANKPDNASANVEEMPAEKTATVAAPSYTFDVTEKPTLTGYEFLGWSKEQDDTAEYAWDTNKASVPVDYDEDDKYVVETATTTKTVYAVWKQMDFTLSFDTQVEGLAATPATKTVTYLEKYGELASVERTGYTFLGWTFDKEGKQLVTADSIVNITADHTVYAQWKAHTYTVRFNKNHNEAAGTMQAQTFTYDVETLLSANAFTRAHYQFIGWSTTPNGEVVYTDEHMIKNLTAQNGGVIDLYAKWFTNEQYVITYNSNATNASFNGNKVTVVESKLHDSPYTIKTPTELKVDRGEYWVWTEWNTKADGSGTQYLGTQQYTTNENLTLYAIWKPKTEVTFSNPVFERMTDGHIERDGDYKFTIQGKTVSGAEGIAIPINNLIKGEAYRLTFTVELNDLKFYEEDNHSYMFGTTIIDQYKGYNEDLSILNKNGAYTTSTYENMMWSTEENVNTKVELEFVATNETMYWFWETTDIQDGILMTYIYNNFNIQIIDQPKPYLDFKNLYVNYDEEGKEPPSTTLSKWGWSPDYSVEVRHKNYFHVEQFDFDYLRYRMWGTEGYELLTIPIKGLKVDEWYTLSFNQDLTHAKLYSGNQAYGSVITDKVDIGNRTVWTGTHGTYYDLKNKTRGEITFKATATTMYWQTSLGGIQDGMTTKTFSWVTLSNVKVKETSAPKTLMMKNIANTISSVSIDGPESVIAGEDCELTLSGADMPDILQVAVNGELYMMSLSGADISGLAANMGAQVENGWVEANGNGSYTLTIPDDLLVVDTIVTISGYNTTTLEMITIGTFGQ